MTTSYPTPRLDVWNYLLTLPRHTSASLQRLANYFQKRYLGPAPTPTVSSEVYAVFRLKTTLYFRAGPEVVGGERVVFSSYFPGDRAYNLSAPLLDLKPRILHVPGPYGRLGVSVASAGFEGVDFVVTHPDDGYEIRDLAIRECVEALIHLFHEGAYQ